ncbi:MAG TPA: hypothetical protein VMM12_19060 [Longimicrobiales bacterium]|nr:hypothetical protein [Longimicrobiales bacterium]
MTSGEELSSALERLPGVLAASAFLDPPHGPRVYLAVTPEADTAALRDAALGLLRDRAVATTPDRVHVGAAPATARDHGALPRFALDGLEVHRADHHARCSVRLRSGGRITEGTGEEPDTRAGRARAAALACLHAAEALDPDLRLGLDGLRATDLFGHDAVMVVVEATAARSHALLPGVALVERSVEEAACLATLSALRSWTV